MSLVSTDQRESIMALHKQGVQNAEIATELDLPLPTVSAVAAWEKIRQSEWYRSQHQDQEKVEDAQEVEAAMEATFGLERDLQMALRASIQQLEPDLSVADGGEEHCVPSGRIDIFARDKAGKLVAIELRAGTVDRLIGTP